MSRVRFLIDECVPSSLTRGLRMRVPEASVLQVGGVDCSLLKGTSDSEILLYCEREKRLLITADRATIPECVGRHLKRGRATWGVLIVGPRTALSRILEELELVSEASQAEDWIDCLHYLPMFA